MLKENKRIITFIIIIVLTVLLSCPIPHRSISVIQYLIPPIRYNNATIYFSTIIFIVLYIIGIVGIISSGKNKRNIYRVLFVVVFILPSFIYWMLDVTRSGYHTLKNDTVQSVDILESHISLNKVNEDVNLTLNLKLKNYNFHPTRFRIKVYLPKTLSFYTGITSYDFSDSYIISPLDDSLSINESFEIPVSDDAYDSITSSNWFNESVRYELYDENISSLYIDYAY